MNSEHKLILIITIMASFVVFLDGSVVNVALPKIAHDLSGGLITQQWVVDAYLLTLGSLILTAGSLSDLFGRIKILVWGLIGFGITSVLCAFAPTSETLIIFRALQGIAGALIVPSSLALIISNFKGAEQAKAIGTWTAWTGISFIIGPLVGGLLIDQVSWRAIFLINVIPISITLFLINKLKQSDIKLEHQKIDYIGVILCTSALSLIVFSLIEQPRFGWTTTIISLLTIGFICLGLFFINEAKTSHAMLPLSLFKIRNFSYGNIATISIYGGLSLATFIILISLIQLGGYTALGAGLSLLPITIIMFFLSPKFGYLAGKYGPRLFMGFGPIIACLGTLLFLRINSSFSYFSYVFPCVLIFGIGLSMTVAPLTAAILGHIPKQNSGIASAVNNAVSRIAGLITISVIGLIIGDKLDIKAFHKSIVFMAILLILGGIVSLIGIRNKVSQTSE